MARFYKPTKKASLDTKHKEIEILRLDHQGEGIGFIDKKPVFVAGVLPGERCVIQYTEQKKQYARAKAIKISHLSTQRIDPICPVYEKCGGCNLQHLSHDGQVEAKQAALSQLMKKFSEINVEQVAPIVSSPVGYRRRTRMSVKLDKQGKLQLGFRQRQSQNIVAISECPVLANELNTLIKPLYSCLDNLRGRRVIGHVELTLADNTPVLLVRTTKTLHAEDKEALVAFAEAWSVSLYLHQSDDEPARLAGEAPYYCLDGINLAFSPDDFIQVNSDINRGMVAQALEWLALEKDDAVLDLFCGLGNFSLPIASRVNSVTGIEGVEKMVKRASSNAALNGLGNALFYQADLNGELQRGQWRTASFNKVLLDPARAGAAGIMEFVAQSGASHVVYVSCNPSTLARDSRVLVEKGYHLVKLGMLDMFPHTGHLESMALFIKK